MFVELYNCLWILVNSVVCSSHLLRFTINCIACWLVIIYSLQLMLL